MCRAFSPEVTVFAPSPLFPAGITACSCCSFNFLAIRGGRATSEAIEGKAMQLSARNQLQGTVVDVTKGETTAHVRINVSGTRILASENL